MSSQNRITTIVNLVLHCMYCQPLSGCILSDLKGKQKQEIFSHLNGLTEDSLERIFSFHEHCPYQGKLAI